MDNNNDMDDKNLYQRIDDDTTDDLDPERGRNKAPEYLEEALKAQKNQQNQQNQQGQQKMFTQADVDRMIQQRLKRYNQQVTSEKDLAARELKVGCKEYLINNNLPLDLADIVSADSIDDFKDRIDKLTKVADTTGRADRRRAPMASTESGTYKHTGTIKDAFAPDHKHQPKSYPPRYEE